MIRWIKRLTIAYVLWRWLGPEPWRRHATPQQHPLRLPGRSVFVGDRELFVREVGPEDASPLVLIHGWAADSILNWMEIIPLLEERHRVVAIDQRNSGKSDYVRERYEIADVADEIAGVIHRLDLGVVDVAGYSMGGMIAQELAHRHPHLVRRLILGGTAATLSPTPMRRFLLQLGMWLGRTWDRVSRVEFSTVRHRYLQRVGAIDSRNARWLWDMHAGRDVNLYYEGGFAVARFDSRPWLRRLHHETLVVIPTDDQLVDPALQYDLASRLPHVEIVELVGARHESVLTHAPEFAQAIHQFVRQSGELEVVDGEAG